MFIYDKYGHAGIHVVLKRDMLAFLLFNKYRHVGLNNFDTDHTP